MSKDIDRFFSHAKSWKKELAALRSVLQQTDLEETFKWRKPCYGYHGANVVIIQPFKACLGLMFFKGKLLKDPKKLLVDNGPNSQAACRLEFTTSEEITKNATTIKAYVKEAIALEKSGAKITFNDNPMTLPEELKKAFAKNAKLKKAFDSLTPGRQRAYVLNITSAKKSETRAARIEKHAPRILAGLGLNDR